MRSNVKTAEIISIITEIYKQGQQIKRHRMQTGYILGFLMVPIFLEGCCVGNFQVKRTGLHRDTPQQHYRAVEGENFMIPSVNPHRQMVCSRTGEGREGNVATSIVCGTEFRAEAKHSGKYTCSGSELFFYLQVVERISLECQAEESSVELQAYVGGEVPCPGLNCSNSTGIIWYKGNETMSGLNKEFCVKETGQLHFCQVLKEITGSYFCDRQIIEQGVTWTFRRAVYVTVIPETAYYSATFTDPKSSTIEVELGRCHTLMCKVYFPFEPNLLVQWYMNYGGNMENRTLLPMESQQFRQVQVKFNQYEVIRRAIIEEVTPQHLNHTYTCIASNSVGNRSFTIRLKEKLKVKWPSLVGYPIVLLLLVAGLGIILHVKWLEIQLIYRSHFQYGKQDGEKEFDVFLSYVWSPPSAEGEGVLTPFFKKGADTDEEACLSSMDQLNTEEGKSTLETLLRQVLEDRWGYRLCLLERDVLPGGAYADDVVLSIQRSQMLICLVSADYLSNSNAVFVLKSGVQALLQNSTLKLLLIWSSRASASVIQPDPPLPTLVQRALRVLPSLEWISGKPARATSSFWRSLRKAMPDQRVKLVSFIQDQ